MNTQPRAEDEVLSQHETQPEAHVGTDEAESAAVTLTATDELSTEDLQDELQVAPEAAEANPDSPEMDVLDQAIEDLGLDEPKSVELAPEELDFEEFLNEELAAQEPATPVEAQPSAEKVAAETPTIAAKFVTESEFEQLVDEALESVGGILLFKMRIDDEGEDKHIAAASIGDGARRQFLLLSLPVVGGKLKVESASRSKSPLAKLAEAYVGVVEAFRSAA